MSAGGNSSGSASALPPACRQFSTACAPPLVIPTTLSNGGSPCEPTVVTHSDVFTSPRRPDDAWEVAIMLNWRIPACAQLIWKRADWRICADGGSNRLYDSVQMVAQNAPPLNAICGDMDSIRQDVLTHFTAQGVKVHDLSHDQDTTDLQKGLALARDFFSSMRDTHKKQQLRVIALGALGGRLDHTLQNVNTLYTSNDDGGGSTTAEAPMELVLVGEHSTARLLRGPAETGAYGWTEHAVPVDLVHEGPTCGICALANASQGRAGVRAVTSGLRWNLDGSQEMAMGFGALQSTSNLVEPVCVDEHGRGHVRVATSGPLLWTTELRGES